MSRKSRRVFNPVAVNPYDVRVGQVWQSDQDPMAALRNGNRAGTTAEMLRYGIRIRITRFGWGKNAGYVFVSNCFGNPNTRRVRLDRFDRYTRIGT